MLKRGSFWLLEGFGDRIYRGQGWDVKKSWVIRVTLLFAQCTQFSLALTVVGLKGWDDQVEQYSSVQKSSEYLGMCLLNQYF